MLIFATKVLFVLGFLYLIVGLTKYRVKWVDELYITLYETEPPKSKEYTVIGVLLCTASIFIGLLCFLIDS